ncbi:stage III sporulation protein AE [Anaerotignum lactatifermentans]|uniref:Stage III sporulation protein AE n=1 Tax=Anaerotignum lactatifermentans TaxID=160404 RepID=A0ABS2G7L7_9FIRM|nr:stage III sporulation protein AE [Anaerotignum lactatifermentans]MBM6828084.1 stage III sporulation protein AE [Anaerotignum lactatifermentans]MBM6876753.1 stage III sporulation protein AE [Anaerotignum lactatifermentans]MBM6949667.1 stage III sporulation protein AE [Anaerotignum lactatifermentans]
MKKCMGILLTLVMLLFPKMAYASDLALSQLEDLELSRADEMAEEAGAGTSLSQLIEEILMGEYSFSMEDWADRLWEMAFGELAAQKSLLIQLLLVVVLAAILRNVSLSFHGRQVGDMGFYVCYMVLIVVILSTFFEITEAVVERIDLIGSIFTAMLPAFLVLAASSGNLTQTALMGPTMMGGCTLMVYAIRRLIVPGVFLAVGLAMTDCLSEKPVTGRLAELLKKGMSWGVKGFAVVFMLLLSLQKIGGGAINSLAVRTAKIAVNAVPVVGNVMGGAVDTAAAVSGTLRNGTLAAAAVLLLLLCLPICVKLAVMTLIFYFAAAAVESFCEERLVQCVSAAGEYMALLLGVVFLAEVMFLFCAVLLLGVI